MKDAYHKSIDAHCGHCGKKTSQKIIYVKRMSSLYDYKPKWYKAYKCSECGHKTFFDVKEKDVPQKIKRYLK